MGLVEVMDLFRTGLPADLPYQGPDTVETQTAPPLISWEPFTVAHKAPRRLGTGAGDEGELWQREISVLVKLWGVDFADTEVLLHRFVNVVHDALSQAGYQLAGESWSHGGPSMSAGYECTLTLVVRVPLPRTVKPTRPITAIISNVHLEA